MKREQDAQGDAISKGWFLIISGIVLVGFALQLPYGNLGGVVGDLSDAVYAQASVPDEEEQVAKAIARSLRSKPGFVEVTHIMLNGFGDKLWKALWRIAGALWWSPMVQCLVGKLQGVHFLYGSILANSRFRGPCVRYLRIAYGTCMVHIWP